MKMRNSFLPLMLGFVIVLIVLLIAYVTKNRNENTSVVSIYYDKPIDIKSTQDLSKIDKINKNNRSVHNPDGFVKPIDEPSRLSKELSKIQNTIFVQDAFGDIIESGTITINEMDFPFHNGKWIVPMEFYAEKLKTIDIQSKGYQSVSLDISLADISSNIIVLEYISIYDIQVFNDDGQPCHGVTVKYWKGDVSKRPIDRIIDKQDRTFQIENNCCMIVKSHPASDSSLSANTIIPNGIAIPKAGDRIVCIGTIGWDINDHPTFYNNSSFWIINYFPLNVAYSHRLRIWDTLNLCVGYEEEGKNVFSQKCEFVRGVERGMFLLHFPKSDLPHNNYFVSETDSKGVFQFIAKEPALYYFQAFNENSQSEIISVHPSCSGGKLYLGDKSKVIVILQKKGVRKSLPSSGVTHSNVQLKSLKKSDGIRYENTEDNNVAIFHNVPYGEYILGIDTEYWSNSEKVVIDKPENRIIIDVPDWEGYSISGKVYDIDNSNPVAGYSLILQDNNEFDIDTQITNFDGIFLYPKIMPGIYQLTGKYSDKDDVIEYLPILSSEINYNENCNFLELIENPNDTVNEYLFTTQEKITVNNKAIQDISIPVRKVVKTKFSGMVSYQNGKPAPDIPLFVNVCKPNLSESKKSLVTFPHNPRSDTQGKFEYFIVSILNDHLEPYIFEISAIQGKVIPTHWEWMSGEAYIFRKESLVPNISGSVRLTGLASESYDNINIILDETNSNIVYGRIVIDEDDLDVYSVYANQYNKPLNVEKKQNGLFEIHNVANSEFQLILYPKWCSVIETPYGSFSPRKYLNESLAITLPKGEKIMTVEIEFKKTGHFWGTVIDSNDVPISDLNIKFINISDRNYCHQQKTDQNGFFFVGDSLDKSKYYDFTVSKENTQNTLFQLNNIQPNKDNLNIKIE